LLLGNAVFQGLLLRQRARSFSVYTVVWTFVFHHFFNKELVIYPMRSHAHARLCGLACGLASAAAHAHSPTSQSSSHATRWPDDQRTPQRDHLPPNTPHREGRFQNHTSNTWSLGCWRVGSCQVSQNREHNRVRRKSGGPATANAWRHGDGGRTSDRSPRACMHTCWMSIIMSN